MYKVMIVDDEPEIRNGLKLKVDWETLNLQIAAEASNGQEALDRIENEAIDIVITDMSMPVMDGKAFLDMSSEQYPSLRLIVLTGYEDFDYARAAVRSQARDYLLKPVTGEELTASLMKVKQELDKEREKQKWATDMEWRLSQNYREMKEHFIIQLVKGELEMDGVVRDRSKLFHLNNWEEGSVSFLTIGLQKNAIAGSSAERRPDQFHLPFEMICRELTDTFEGFPQAFRMPSYPQLMHVVFQESSSSAERFAEKLQRVVEEHLGFALTTGIGQPVSGFSKWKDGFISSLLTWNLTDSNIQAHSGQPDDGQLALKEDERKAIQRLLTRGELQQFEEAVVRELADAASISRAKYVKMIFQLFMILETAAHDAKLPLSSGEQLWLRPELALGLDSIDKAKAFLMGIANRMDLKLRQDADDEGQSDIGAARRFIDENYMYDLHLSMIAEKFNYNSSYFSELFKGKVGKTFIQYLTEVRMSHARRLLEHTALGLWDIAELTGFSNPSYFSSKFKKMFGLSPSDYRQRLPEKNDNALPKK